MFYVILIGVGILVVGTAFVTWNLTRSTLKSKHDKEMKQVAVKNKVKAEKKEEVIRNANEQKAQINASNAIDSFDNTMDILHQLSQRK